MENISHCNSRREETQQDIWKDMKMFVHRRKIPQATVEMDLIL